MRVNRLAEGFVGAFQHDDDLGLEALQLFRADSMPWDSVIRAAVDDAALKALAIR